MSNKLSKIDHICISVADVKNATAWYASSFNCKIIYQDTLQAELEFANIKLHLVLPSKTPAHLAFCRDDAETLGELREQFNAIQSTFIADSSGNPVEIIKEKAL